MSNGRLFCRLSKKCRLIPTQWIVFHASKKHIFKKADNVNAEWKNYILDSKLVQKGCLKYIRNTLQLQRFAVHFYPTVLCKAWNRERGVSSTPGGFHLYLFPFNFPFIYVSNKEVQESVHNQFKIFWYGVLLETRDLFWSYLFLGSAKWHLNW